MRIAIDAMGGDFAPENVVLGAIEALRESKNRFEIILVGQESVLKNLVHSNDQKKYALTIVNASEVIDMYDSANVALRQKKDSSIVIGLTLHKESNADAFISAGHTGAVISASTIILGRLEGVGRPTIGAFFPTETGICLVLDAGANIDCRARHLFEFATMGSIYVQEIYNIENPLVGLLNIGEEETKGVDVVKEAYKLLKESSLNFIGNIEGRDILQGKANVVVCDGFIGNIILKFAESIPGFLRYRLKKSANSSILTKLFAMMMRRTLRKALKCMDYEEYGGVPILGVNGVSIIGHGKSTPKAFKNMIFKAEEIVRKNINKRIQEKLSTTS